MATTKGSSSVDVSRLAAAAGAILLCLVCVFAARARLQTQSMNSQTGGSLAVVEPEARDKTIQFGDELVVLLTLQNNGRQAIGIPGGALLLKNRGWSGHSIVGSGSGESPLIPAGGHGKKEEFLLQPGESVALTASNIEMASTRMGPMKADFVIETEDETIRRELGKPVPFTIPYYVAPSELMISAWSAGTSEERTRLQSQIKDLLLLASRMEEVKDRNYVEGTLTYMGCYAVPFLESAMKDSDPIVRQQAVNALDRLDWNAYNLNFFVDDLLKRKEGGAWAGSVGKCDEDQALRDKIRLASSALGDGDARVRIAAISVLTHRAAAESNLRRWRATNPRGRDAMEEREKREYDSIGLVDPALPLVKKLASDADPGVRAETQKFLSNFASQQGVAGDVVVSLSDPDAGVRSQALKALKTSHEPPPMSTIEKAFASTEGDVSPGLIELMYEQEDSELAARLTPGFKDRSAAERLKILTVIAGHTDEAALKLAISGLKDSDAAVRRTSLTRLLGFPAERVLSVIRADSAVASGDVGAAVQRELTSRALFPFLAHRGGSAVESVFPSVQGTGPVVSPDGKWVAYVETGWGRPGGTGGSGRSNLLSITHVATRDGSVDRVVSDMFLVGWMSDSRRLASAREGFATIVNLNSKIVAEFGDLLDEPYTGRGFNGESWPTGDIRHQWNLSMPHSKRIQRSKDLDEMSSFDYGEDAAFSPDGKWFGPRTLKDVWQLEDSEGHKIELKTPEERMVGHARSIWSPDGANIVVIPIDEAIESRKAFVIDFAGRALRAAVDVDRVPTVGGWNYRKGRLNPWSRDGKHLTFIRQGQVWTSDPDGRAIQVTFDSSNKIFPTFSPDGSKVAYITWQFDNREHYTRPGPTDIWVVDIKTGLSARVTRADPGRIEGLDWLDNGTLIYDRLAADEMHSTLRVASLR